MKKALCLFRDQYAHVRPVESFLNGKVEFIYDSTWNEKVIEESPIIKVLFQIKA